MNKTNMVSIIMPTFNTGHLIGRAITSVVDQSYKNWELIIIDNHSDDKTIEIIKNFNDKRISFSQINNGGIIAKSRNKGIEISKGEWIAFLDADDWWTPDKLQISLCALKKGHDFVYHDLFKSYEKKIFSFSRKVKTKQAYSPVYKFLLENGNVIANSSVVLRASTLKKINCISEDPSLIAAEDFDCWLRFAKETDRFKRIGGCHGYYWIGANNTSSAKNTVINLKYIIKSHYEDLNEAEKKDIDMSKLVYSIIKSYLVLGDYDKANRYQIILKKFRVNIPIRFKLILLNLVSHIRKLIE